MKELLTDVKKLHDETLENLKSSKANNTLRAYKSDFRDFGAFCAKHGTHVASGTSKNHKRLQHFLPQAHFLLLLREVLQFTLFRISVNPIN